MSKKHKVLALCLLAAGVLVAAAVYFSSLNIPVLEPGGEVGEKQRNLMYFSLLLSVIVVVPVFAMLFLISWKYRQGNPKNTRYDPDWDHSRAIELTWWAIPSAIILVLAVITWNSSHDLDPFKPLNSNTKPLNIQVVALQWKWLFIYPEQNISTVNYAQFPVNTPLNFTITADAPMNSFWIPQLGSQIYAMPGMSTQLHLIANREGDFTGRSANISGRGFTNMNFVAKATSHDDFKGWINSVRQAKRQLTLEEYDRLSRPSEPGSPIYYSGNENELYAVVVGKYMPKSQQDKHRPRLQM